MAKGVGADLYLPKDIEPYLGVPDGDHVGFDFSGALTGKAPQLSQAPQPGTLNDYQIGQNIRSQIGQQPASSMIAGDMTADAVSQAMKGGPKAINANGSIDYGNGISYFKGQGIIQYDTGTTRYQWLPGQTKPVIQHHQPQV